MNEASRPRAIAWRKSTRSNSGAEPQCVEAGVTGSAVAVRDSFRADVLLLGHPDWTGLLAAIADGRVAAPANRTGAKLPSP